MTASVMALDELQKRILRTLSKTRSKKSVFAGGSLLNRHGPRLSNDQDIFVAEDVDAIEIALTDIDELKKAGFNARITKQYEGFIEAVVGNEDMGSTLLQWTQAGSWAFFTPVQDPDYGFRLHMCDLAINKTLAAVGRREARDYVDIHLIDKFIMPLWVAIWAAPGKDEKWTPLSIVDRIARQNAFRQEEFDRHIVSLVDVSAKEISSGIAAALERAKEIFNKIEPSKAGLLPITSDLLPVMAAEPNKAVEAIRSARWIEAKKGGGLPSSPDIDHALVIRMIVEFGRNAEALPKPSGDGDDGVGGGPPPSPP